MPKQNQVVGAKSDRQNRLKVEPVPGPEQTAEQTGLPESCIGPLGASGDGSVENQAALLGDARLPTVQRRALAAQVGRLQGNRHLQRVVAAITSQQREPPATSRARQVIGQLPLHVQDTGQVVQRTSDEVVLEEPVRPDAQACLVHLHGSERTALRVAEQLYAEYRVNFVHIRQIDPRRDPRYIKVDFRPGGTCQADPNRIFQRDAIEENWNVWNPSHDLQVEPSRTAAIDAVVAWRNERLGPAIERGRGNPVTPEDLEGGGHELPIVALHNNTYTPGPRTHPSSLSIFSYQSDPEVTPAVARASNNATDAENLRHAYDQLRRDPGLPSPSNPHIGNPSEADNFVLVTDWRDFVTFVRRGRNTVLQASAPPEDGSLSVLYRSQRYINVEARRGGPGTAAERFEANLRMGREAMAALGVERLSGPTTPAEAAGPAGAAAPAPSPVRRKEADPQGTTRRVQIPSNEQQVQRHGAHGALSLASRYRHTLEHAHIRSGSPSAATVAAWESGYRRDAAFLGVPITNGVHQELLARLSAAETYLRGRYSGSSDAQIATRVGLSYIRGLRRPSLASGETHISFHCFGLAIDVNWRQNILIAQDPREAQVIRRATDLMLGSPIDVRASPAGQSLEALRGRYQQASDALLQYFALLDDRARLVAQLRAQGLPTDDRSVSRQTSRIRSDLRFLRANNRGSGWDPATTGFIDLTEDLVVALGRHGGLEWGGQFRHGRDLHHFQYIEGTVAPGDRV